jgi:hypothetical protein
MYICFDVAAHCSDGSVEGVFGDHLRSHYSQILPQRLDRAGAKANQIFVRLRQ